jgi:hypothetical protein
MLLAAHVRCAIVRQMRQQKQKIQKKKKKS